MSELTILLSDQQQQHLQQTIHQLLITEINHVQKELGIGKRYLKKNQLCTYLNLSNNTLDKLLMAGLPKINIHGIILYDKFAVDKWLITYSQSA